MAKCPDHSRINLIQTVRPGVDCDVPGCDMYAYQEGNQLFWRTRQYY